MARADEIDDIVQAAEKQAAACAGTDGDSARDASCRELEGELEKLHTVVSDLRACTGDCTETIERFLTVRRWAGDALRAPLAQLGATWSSADIRTTGEGEAVTMAAITKTESKTKTATATTAATAIDLRSWCELGNAAACTTVSTALTSEELTAWWAHACADRGVADACFALADGAPRFAARGVRLLDKKCKRRRDATACHRLAAIYASGAHGVAAAPRRAKAYESLTRKLAAAAAR